MSSSWHSWEFWSYTAGTYFWFCHANNISPAVPVRHRFPASTKCVGQRGKTSVERKGKMSQGSSCASSTGLKSCFFFSSPIPGALSKLSSQAGQSWSSSTGAAAVFCSQWSGWSLGPCRQGAEFRKWGGKQWEHLFCFTGRTRIKMFLCPISPVHTLAGGEEQGYGVVHSIFFPSSCIPLCCSFLCWLFKPGNKLVKAILQNTSPPPFSPTGKLHLPEFCGGLMLVLP